jgi:hypothetical protein
LAWISGILAVLALSGCKQKEHGSFIEVSVAARIGDPQVPRVSFGIVSIGKQAATHWSYAASYTRQGRTARFLIDLRPSTLTTGAATMQTGNGSFIAVSHSDNTLLLQDLTEVLKADKASVNNIRVRELPFRFDVLGENMDRGSNGNLVDAATGNWISLRLYLGV